MKCYAVGCALAILFSLVMLVVHGGPSDFGSVRSMTDQEIVTRLHTSADPTLRRELLKEKRWRRMIPSCLRASIQ
jgi:hypothetical protein